MFIPIGEIEAALAAGRRIKLTPDADLRLYYGCGTTRQPGYVNVDARRTDATDLVAELGVLACCLKGCCTEVYMSHVLEHFGSPGKAMRKGDTDVLGAILLVKKMLRTSGIIRIAVPDFKALCGLYLNHKIPLHPKILGRISGEQEYPENLHRCVFDHEFLTFCLTYCGFEDVQSWDPAEEGFVKDSSFDHIRGVSTSLNLMARLSRKGVKDLFKWR